MLKNTVAELILHCLNVQMRNLFFFCVMRKRIINISGLKSEPWVMYF